MPASVSFHELERPGIGQPPGPEFLDAVVDSAAMVEIWDFDRR